MRIPTGSVALAVPLAATLAVAPLPSRALGAQVIPIKTVPVAAGDQFLVFPSDHLGMASVGIALQDTLGDPFSNPATLGRLAATRVFGAPTAYAISDGHGSGYTLPVGGLFTASSWRTGFGLALQEVDRGGLDDPWGFSIEGLPAAGELSGKSKTNLYGFGAVARTFGPDGGASVGASVSVADLTAVQGVDLLYARRTAGQDGSIVDARLGLATTSSRGEVWEGVVVLSRTAIDHALVDVVWDVVEDGSSPVDQWTWEPRVVETVERDRTDTWAFQLGWSRPLEEDGWRVGAVLNANYKSHPKIPNYTIMSIPRDPGDSWAYDLGFGVSKRTATSVFGVDVVYEPIWTQTWADASVPTETATGDTIPPGSMTVFNDFRFGNAIVRMGVGGRSERVDLQFGLRVKRYGYTLDQTDFVLETRRRQREGWLEWTPSLAIGFRFDDFSIGYTGRVTTGTGRPGVAAPPFRVADAATAAAVDFIPAPTGALTLVDATVHTHRVSVSIPVGR